jgi:hypothetical protein
VTFFSIKVKFAGTTVTIDHGPFTLAIDHRIVGTRFSTANISAVYFLVFPF